MRVGLITSVPVVPPWDQGDKNLAYALAGALSNIRFQVLTTRGDTGPPGENLERHPLYHSRRPTLYQKMRVYAWFLSAGRRSTPDLYHFIYQPLGMSSKFIKWLPVFRRRPGLHTVPATANGHRLHPSLFVADRVVALSEHGRRTLQRAGIQNVVHIPQGICVDEWPQVDRQSHATKAQLGVEGKRIVLYPGHFNPRYGIDVLLQALPLLVSQVLDAHVILACRSRSRQDAEYEKDARREIGRLGLDHVVTLCHTVHDMKALIGASDVVVLPFRTMKDKVDIPTTLLECLAAAKPILISDIPPMNELPTSAPGAHNPDAVGLAVSPGDPEALGEAIATVLRDRHWAADMGRRGQALVRAQYDIREVARRYETLYRELLG